MCKSITLNVSFKNKCHAYVYCMLIICFNRHVYLSGTGGRAGLTEPATLYFKCSNRVICIIYLLEKNNGFSLGGGEACNRTDTTVLPNLIISVNTFLTNIGDIKNIRGKY